MTTAFPHEVRPPALAPLGERDPGRVRAARPADAAALYALSEPFMRSGALRRRSRRLYELTADQFLVAEDADGTPEGCVALRTYPDEPAAVLHNFCVRADRQRRGVGSRLLAALLSEAAARPASGVFAATTGGGRSFLRAGFRETDASAAPRPWAAALDPARGSRIFVRDLPFLEDEPFPPNRPEYADDRA
ncbi:GNAT family N-acetyltransferase [Streptomyces mobaraensis]|nr:GNAT family N-acetyltransferase [Streptomyces mobaraensis]EME99879.1 N-acetylglutamate synthase [Streptomyces mobaraensis NBRC 13819 = DSM 40847]